MANPQYNLGVFVGGTWRQWATASGQEYYENLNTRATQYEIPAGWEDAATDTWVADGSKSWPQMVRAYQRNIRTGRIRHEDPNPPPPRTYLDRNSLATHLRLVERMSESQEYLYRRVIVSMLRYFFTEDEGFDVCQEEPRGELDQTESRADMTVLKLKARPGGSMYAYDYCLVESKRANRSWTDTQNHLSRHCGGTENQSGRVYGIVHVGLHVQFFNSNRGVLTPLSGGLHVRNDVNTITTMFQDMKRRPPPYL